MNPSSDKLVTFNVKKTQRLESKKRKVEALLDLFESTNCEIVDSKKKTKDTLEGNYKDLKNELKKYMKKPSQEPIFKLTKIGERSQINFKKLDVQSFSKLRPICTEDIFRFILKTAVGHMSPYDLVWSNIEHPQHLSRSIFFVVSGLSINDIIQSKASLIDVVVNFPFLLKVVSSNIPFATELCTSHLITDFHIQTEKTYSTMFHKKKEVKLEPLKNDSVTSRLHLLLSPIQLVMENYPLPQCVFQYAKSKHYKFTKDEYTPVTTSSPIFSIDCEMCRTENDQNELTRIAVVNENMETVYHTFVKPKARIVDYMTRYSGITKKTLSDVHTRLCEVQAQLQTILPTDAILCGHSLNCDLHALKMIHPYVIDTSTIFNTRGVRSKKDSLRYLSSVHLDTVIQNSKKGHDPVEDAVATMKLVLLKLGNPIQYGDACLSNSLVQNSDQIKTTEEETVEGTSEVGRKEGFFAETAKIEKKVCLVGEENSLNHYLEDMLTENVEKFVKTTPKKIIKASLNNLENFDVVISHVDFKEQPDPTNDFGSMLKEVFAHCQSRTMISVYLSSVDEANYEDVKNGLLMCALKKAE